MPRTSLPAVLVLGLFAAPAAAQLPPCPPPPTGWVGEFAILKKPHVAFDRTEDGKKVVLGELTEPAYTVLEETKDRIRVKHKGVEGWIDKADAVLLQGAAEHFTALLKKDRRNAFALGQRGAAQALHGNHDEALADFNRALRIEPKSVLLLRSRGKLWADRGDLRRAIADLDRVLELNPKDAAAYHARGAAHIDAEDYDEAIRDMSEAIKHDEELVLSFIYRGLARSHKKQFERAVADLDEALRLDPNSVPGHTIRSNVHWKKKDYPRALADLEQALRIDPDSTNAQNDLAWYLCICPEAKYRDGKRALELANQVCEATGFQYGAYVDTLAAAHAELGQFEEAVRRQEEALDVDEDFARRHGTDARQRLELFKAKKPYREE